MDLWIILVIIISSCLIGSLFLMIIFLKKSKKQKLLKITNDINECYNNLSLTKISKKELSVSLDEINENIYYSDKVIKGRYQHINKIKGQNTSLKPQCIIDKNYDKNLFLRYKLFDVSFLKSSDFIPINQIDVLLSKTSVYFIDPFEPQVLSIKHIKHMTFFWEKNNHLVGKRKFIGVEIFCYDKKIFFIFNKYESAITFVTSIIMLF